MYHTFGYIFETDISRAKVNTTNQNNRVKGEGTTLWGRQRS